MVLCIFGTRRSARVAPDGDELLQENIFCGMTGCRDRVRVMEVNRHFHICCIPLYTLATRKFVRCQGCNTTITLKTHMSTRNFVKNIPVGVKATAMASESDDHDEPGHDHEDMFEVPLDVIDYEGPIVKAKVAKKITKKESCAHYQ
jgi:hypothetical protein